jgi:hypothetical protein
MDKKILALVSAFFWLKTAKKQHDKPVGKNGKKQ